ncbi:cell division protein FtsZ [Clostridium sp. JS66]|uniref:cell division protein FtsZ n=1 Tax=Clostridium sp. JS66 TaxID=3064705 RepID=UPI00298E7284|nr:cell division protein FtsZ [Clostridium sp. JS66]WPC44050.1 cell division protein FtsZ [Clostridium sp. JS66]
MHTMEEIEGMYLTKSIIFCTCQDRYDRIGGEFNCKLDNVNKVLIRDEFLNEVNIEGIIYPSIYKAVYQSGVCYVIVALEQERDLKIAKYIYKIAKKKDILTIGIGIKPSLLQNKEFREICDSRIEMLKNNLDSLVLIDNEVLSNSENIILDDIEKQSSDNVIATLKSMIYPISLPGVINIEVSDLKYVMSGNTIAYIGFGSASGDNKAEIAAEKAINSKLLVEPLKKATKQLLMIEGGPSMDLMEIYKATKKVSDVSDCDINNIFFGAVINEDLKDEIQVSIVASGYDAER